MNWNHAMIRVNAAAVLLFFTGTACVNAQKVEPPEAIYSLDFNNQTLGNYGSVGGAAVANAVRRAVKPVYMDDTPDGSSYALGLPVTAQKSQYLTLPDSASRFSLSNKGDQMTLAAWVYWDGYVNQNTIASKGGVEGWFLSITDEGKLQFFYGAGGSFSSNGNRLSAKSIPEGQWIHVAVQWDCAGDLTAGRYRRSNLKFYIDGADAGMNASFSGADRCLSPNTNEIFVADTFGTGSRPLNGRIDNFAMYEVILSDAQMLALAAIDPSVTLEGGLYLGAVHCVGTIIIR